MNRFAIILILLFGTLICHGQTNIYKKYASRTDIRVASVNNFTLDSGITADVTLLEALDDSGWEWLRNEFSLATPTEEQQKQIAEGWDVVFFAQRDRQDPTKPVSISNDNVSSSSYIGVSYLNHTLYIFSCNTDRQSDVIVNYLIEKMRRH